MKLNVSVKLQWMNEVNQSVKREWRWSIAQQFCMWPRPLCFAPLIWGCATDPQQATQRNWKVLSKS